jgi:hypothetical protein
MERRESELYAETDRANRYHYKYYDQYFNYYYMYEQTAGQSKQRANGCRAIASATTGLNKDQKSTTSRHGPGDKYWVKTP